jgi:flagellar hook-basal body complex protein FliE
MASKKLKKKTVKTQTHSKTSSNDIAQQPSSRKHVLLHCRTASGSLKAGTTVANAHSIPCCLSIDV